jgi:tetratricopeptide (TPR) repeat protein
MVFFFAGYFATAILDSIINKEKLFVSLFISIPRILFKIDIPDCIFLLMFIILTITLIFFHRRINNLSQRPFHANQETLDKANSLDTATLIDPLLGSNQERVSSALAYLLHNIKSLSKDIISSNQPLSPKKDSDKYEDYFFWFNKGLYFVNNREYLSALNSFEKAICFKSDDASSWNNKAMMLLALNKNDDALLAIDRAIELDPKKEEPWSNKGKILAHQHLYAEALDALAKSLQINPTSAAVWFNKGVVEGLILNRYEDALISVNKAIELKHFDSETYSLKGDVLYKMKKYDDSFIAIEKSLEYSPNNVSSLINKGRILLIRNKEKEAIDSFNSALRLQPANILALSGKAISLFFLGRDKEAIEVINITTKLNAENEGAWLIAAGLLLIKKYEHLSIKYLKRAIKINPAIKKSVIKDAIFIKLIDNPEFKKLVS